LGLARIAIATLAVAVALGLVIIGGVALWGALTNKESARSPADSPAPSDPVGSSQTPGKQSGAPPDNQINNVQIQCLAAQCPVFVSGPTADVIQYNGTLRHGQRRDFSETRLTVAVDDGSTVVVSINGRMQPRGRRGQRKTYEVPAHR
jgi:hypothetical protein